MDSYSGSVGRPKQSEAVKTGEVRVEVAKIAILSYEGNYLADKIINMFQDSGFDVLMQPIPTMNDRDSGARLTIYSKR